MYKWSMGVDYSVGTDCGTGAGGGLHGGCIAKKVNWDNCNRITIKNVKICHHSSLACQSVPLSQDETEVDMSVSW